MNPVRIDKADLIGGVPIVRVRDALMRSDQFSLARLAALLHVTPEAAQVVLDELVERGYVEPFAGVWQTTIGGNALAGARLGPGVPRRARSGAPRRLLDSGPGGQRHRFLGWPEIEVHRHLKSRSRVLAIVDRRDIPPDAPSRVIFRRGMPDQDALF